MEFMDPLARLEEADRKERRIDGMYDWPLDTQIVRRLAALSVTVLMVLFTRYVATLFGI